MFSRNKRALITICALFAISSTYSEPEGSFAEQHPTQAAVAQVSFAYPFICSALLSTLMCMTYNGIAKQDSSCGISDALILSTLLGWPVLFRLAHQYLINTHIEHGKTTWCTNQCKNSGIKNLVQLHMLNDENAPMLCKTI